MKHIYVDLQAADQNSIGIGLDSDIGQPLQDGEQVILYDDELEVEATLHSKAYMSSHGSERYWLGTFDESTIRQKTA